MTFHHGVLVYVVVELALCVTVIGMVLYVWATRGYRARFLVYSYEVVFLGLYVHYLLSWPVEPRLSWPSLTYWMSLLCSTAMVIAPLSYELACLWRRQDKRVGVWYRREIGDKALVHFVLTILWTALFCVFHYYVLTTYIECAPSAIVRQ